MALIGRLFVILFAIVLATLATGIAIVIVAVGPQWHAFSGEFSQRAGFWIAVFFATSFTGAVGLLPAVILIALAEAFKVRSLLAHLIVGAALIAAGYYASGLAPPSYEESIDHSPPVIPRGVEIAAAGGAVFGLAYWLIAGRNAGRWREPRQPAA
jgi:hypothetical protein